MSQGQIFTAFVVDDEHAISSTITMILNLSGYYASPFFSAEEAISAAARSGPPDILITDVFLPGMNGSDLAIHFKAQYPKCKTLLISGQTATADLLSKAREEGHEFPILAKPIPPEHLIAAIASVITV
jgi:DNA-binding NtrC family response regulator